MRKWIALAAAAVAALGLSLPAVAQDTASPSGKFPRNETLIINNPENPAANPGMFNIWVAGSGGNVSNGLQQLVHGHAVVPRSRMPVWTARSTTSSHPSPGNTMTTSPR